MFSVKTREGLGRKSSSVQSSAIPSQALQWIWNFLQDVDCPHVLDCGAVSSATVSVMVKRHAKVYVADLLAPLQCDDPKLWRKEGKLSIFCLDELLKDVPGVPPSTLNLICCWHLLDLVPREQLADLVNHLLSLLAPGGIFFCFLRESNLAEGREARWRFETLTTLGAEEAGSGQFPYAPLSNREIENLTAGCSLKTFLTRSHRREVVVLKAE